mgnify:CR=1 FL=1
MPNTLHDSAGFQMPLASTRATSRAGKAGQSLTENEWLMSIRSRISIPGGTCEFDLPAYYAWQHHPAGDRRADLERWAGTLAPLLSLGQLQHFYVPGARPFAIGNSWGATVDFAGGTANSLFDRFFFSGLAGVDLGDARKPRSQARRRLPRRRHRRRSNWRPSSSKGRR